MTKTAPTIRVASVYEIASKLLADRTVMYDLYRVPLHIGPVEGIESDPTDYVFLLRGPLDTVARFLDLRPEAILRLYNEMNSPTAPEHSLVWNGSRDLGNKTCHAVHESVEILDVTRRLGY